MAAELDLRHRARVARAVTHLTWHVPVGEEVHVDLDDAVAFARLTSPTLHVEAEPPRLVSAHLRLGQAREQLTHVREHARVRRRVGARRAPYGRLGDVDGLVHMLEAFDRTMRPGLVLCPVDVLRHLPAEDVGHARWLARSP